MVIVVGGEIGVHTDGCVVGKMGRSTGRRAAGEANGWVHGKMGGWTGRSVGAWKDGWVDRQMCGWTGSWVDGTLIQNTC